MINASNHSIFVDRRTAEQRTGELATQVLFWYDEAGKGNKRRRRTNGIAMTTDGFLIVARAMCSRKDQFVKTHGRMVVEKRILGRAQDHCWTLYVNERDVDLAEAAAAAYSVAFPGDETGFKRAFNAGKIFVNYQTDIEKRANQLDEA